jgi:signal transduction histidine kinase
MGNVADDAERLRRLHALTDAALGHLQLGELLDALLGRTKDLLGVDTCAVLLLDDDRRELVPHAAVGIEEPGHDVRIPVGRGFAGRVAAERRPVVLEDVEWADLVNPILREQGIKSLLGVPLVAHDEVIGVLHVGSLVRKEFADADIELIQLVAARTAIAIENARLYESERAARMRLEHVQAITDAALAHLEIDELLAVLLPRIRAILEADTCAVLLLDERRQELVARAAVGVEEEVERGVRIPIGRGFAGRVAAERRPVSLDDVDHADVLNPILREKGIKSLLGVPLVVRDEVIGVLHVGSLSPRTFTRDDTALLQLVAERVAVAVERAQLHEEVVLLDQLKLNFVTIASHELRTPAAAVYGVLATLVRRGDELAPETREELVRAGHEQGERLRRLIEQLLDLSRLDAHAIGVEPRPLVLHSVLTDIANAAVPAGMALEVDVAPDVAVIADALVLDRVLSNVLINAARYGEPPIRVAAEQRDRHIRIAIEDQGPGVPEELLSRLFERFARGDDPSGSGLGLAIARAYARAHGGDLVYSPGERGARFELIVPRA